mgnify:CR=1 FL=1
MRRNHVGLSLSRDINLDDLFKPCYGAVILELLDASAGEFLGSTTVDYVINVNGENIDLQHLQDVWEAKLQPVFPYLKAGEEVKSLEYKVNCFQRVAPACAPGHPAPLSSLCSPAPTANTTLHAHSAAPVATRTFWF